MNRFKFRVWKQDSWDCNIKNEFVKQEPHYEYFELNSNIVIHNNDITEQCSGLKDKNGKLIYEGDIVKTRQHTQNCIVVWFDKDASFSLKSTTSDEYYPIYCYDGFEILGNVHENPELLEDK